MVDHKDVVLALLGASGALAGLVLVFLGLVATASGAYDPGTKRSIVRKALRPAFGLLASFAFGIACVGVAAWWLVLLHGNRTLYAFIVALFIAQLATLAAATIWTVATTLGG